MSFIAGAYTATLDASTLGQMEKGFTLEFSFFKRMITGDNFGDAPQDAIFRGMQQFIQYTLLEYNAVGALKAMFPYGTTLLTLTAPMGVLDSSLAKSLILTAVSGTPSAAAPATLTLPRSILAANYPINLLFAPDLRTVPIRQRCYPDAQKVFGTLT